MIVYLCVRSYVRILVACTSLRCVSSLWLSIMCTLLLFVLLVCLTRTSRCRKRPAPRQDFIKKHDAAVEDAAHFRAELKAHFGKGGGDTGVGDKKPRKPPKYTPVPKKLSVVAARTMMPHDKCALYDRTLEGRCRALYVGVDGSRAMSGAQYSRWGERGALLYCLSWLWERHVEQHSDAVCPYNLEAELSALV